MRFFPCPDGFVGLHRGAILGGIYCLTFRRIPAGFWRNDDRKMRKTLEAAWIAGVAALGRNGFSHLGTAGRHSQWDFIAPINALPTP
jgi:hypothetical protein